MGLIALVVLHLVGLPRLGYSRNWGYRLSGGLGVLLVVVLVILGRGVSPPHFTVRGLIRSGIGANTDCL